MNRPATEARQLQIPVLEVLDPSKKQKFSSPIKRINEGQDVSTFLTSRAYTDIMTFVMQLNRAMFPSFTTNSSIQTYELESPDVHFSPTVQSLHDLLEKLEAIIDEAPPDTGPRRFGNVSFRKWYDIVEVRINELLASFLPASVIRHASEDSDVNAVDELRSYLLGSFGSPQRLDYGTGHELSFLAFLGCIWKLGGFENLVSGMDERAIVLGVVEQ